MGARIHFRLLLPGARALFGRFRDGGHAKEGAAALLLCLLRTCIIIIIFFILNMAAKILDGIFLILRILLGLIRRRRSIWRIGRQLGIE